MGINKTNVNICSKELYLETLIGGHEAIKEEKPAGLGLVGKAGLHSYKLNQFLYSAVLLYRGTVGIALFLPPQLRFKRSPSHPNYPTEILSTKSLFSSALEAQLYFLTYHLAGVELCRYAHFVRILA